MTTTTKARPKSLQLDLPDGTQTPPIVAAFLIVFDNRAGYTIAWKRSIPNVEIDGVVEFRSLPSGLHNVSKDLVYFIHENYAGISAFVNNPASESERNALMLAVGVLVPLSYGRLGRSWRHAEGIKKLAKQLGSDLTNKEPLEKYWQRHALHEDEGEEEAAPASPVDSPSPANIKFKPVKRSMNGAHRAWTMSDSTTLPRPPPRLFPHHPALSLPDFVNTFGPLIFPIYKAALLRQRILLVTPAPVELSCNFAYDVLPHNFRSSRIRPLFSIGVHDIPLLEQEAQKKSNSPTSASHDEDSNIGWIACTTDDVLTMKQGLYDLVITMPPPHADRAASKVWPQASSSPANTPVRATQRDLRRYLTFCRGLHRIQQKNEQPFQDSDEDNELSHNDEDDNVPLLQRQSTDNPRPSSHDDNEPTQLSLTSSMDPGLIEPMSWSLLVYDSFMWWASAGEKRSDLAEEETQDASLLTDFNAPTPSPPSSPVIRRSSSAGSQQRQQEGAASSTSKKPKPRPLFGPSLEMAIVAYFHRWTMLILTTLAELLDAADSDSDEAAIRSDDDDDGEVVYIESEDLVQMGLDPWSESDRKFVEDAIAIFWEREGRVRGRRVECCGLRI
ncbi:MAG: hypothetical protein M1834_000146 [Cirrosporium novae-zelandiae]|nr:MAG: hypothetical protein M1834_000146 [Cirrosporium novae-zelandiae]